MLAHKASHEGRTAVEAIAGHKVAFEPNAIPAVVFTDPEIAWAGLTETQAQKENREIKVAKFPWAASGRAMTLDRTEGMTKLILDPKPSAFWAWASSVPAPENSSPKACSRWKWPLSPRTSL